MPLTLGIVGYSTRALVQAATELGHRAVAIDAFNDHDTQAMAQQVELIDDWPAGILISARKVAVDAWLLAGGMENHPAIIEELRSSAPVLGPNQQQLQALRAIEFMSSLCTDDICWPTTLDSPPKDDLANWLRKSLHGAGGLSVRSAQASDLQAKQDDSVYWQQRIVGRGLGVSWILREQSCRLIGVTGSLHEQDWPGPTEFIYRGSFGPLEINERQEAAIVRLGQRVHAQLPDYRGYLQADLIADKTGRLWLLEFNPRWTAGMETMHEAASCPERTPLSQHLQAWGIEPVQKLAWDKPATRFVSKAIHYASVDLQLDQETRRNLQKLLNWQNASNSSVQWCVADLPEVTEPAPMRFDSGSPILTVKCRVVPNPEFWN